MLDFAVIGAGPVGLLCAVALRRLGRTVTVLERCKSPRRETRSIGVHAASLACLDELGLLDPFLASGVRIRRGVAVGSRGRLGVIDFGDATARFGYALSLPQPRTEALLEAAARAAGVELLRDTRFVGLDQRSDRVVLSLERDGRRQTLGARHLIGCDGTHSRVRACAKIPTRARKYAGSYLMAEFPSTPGLGDDAWIFLADHGLAESFPLPSGRRRWVVEAPTRCDHVELEPLCELIRARTGHRLDPHAGRQASAFGITQALAERLRCGRVVLLGDAAHTLSPFGGQGMNLGWLDAVALAHVVAASWTRFGVEDTALERWAWDRRRAACRALRQAAWNTRVGRRPALPRARNALVRAALLGPLAGCWSRRFAMLALAPRV